LNAGFTFRDATAIVPYLAQLGISHVYCSPYFRARSGSTHGYDVVDHNSFNPEIGERDDFELFVAALRAHGMGHILDIVPNHVGILGADNAWWMDVLENGEASGYAAFFDIDWAPSNPDRAHKVLVPVLADLYGTVPEVGAAIEAAVRSFGGTAAEPASFDALHELLELQAYHLAYWRVAAEDINYRRFFDVNDLAALRVDNEAVFEVTHRLVLQLIGAGMIDGLRVDHVDGLYDPAGYVRRLHARVGAVTGRRGARALYLVVEKITASFEHLPSDWPVHGETGY